MSLRMPALGLALSTLLFASAVLRAAQAPPPAADHTIAVADFSGHDPDLGRFLADTLLTDLAQSQRLHLVERSEIRQALTELKLQSTGLTDPQGVRKVGKLVGADLLIVGSYLIQDKQMVLNARLLDVHTGRVTTGGAANVSGGPEDMLPLVHRLTHLFHKRVTGEDLVLEGETPPEAAPSPAAPTPAPSQVPAAAAQAAPESTPVAASPTATESTPSQLPAVTSQAGEGLAPPVAADPPRSPSAPPNESETTSPWAALHPGSDARISERDLAGVIRQIARHTAGQFFIVNDPEGCPSRLLALTALVRAVLPPAAIKSYRAAPAAEMPPDAAWIPFSARPCVAAAVDHGWLYPQRLLHPDGKATWGFVETILKRMTQKPGVPATVEHARREFAESHDGQANPGRDRPASPSIAPDLKASRAAYAYTGLIVDAHGFPVDRDMSVRILDEDGHVVYPERDHIPDPDYVIDRGMADYCHDGSTLGRAGEHPLVVRGVGASGVDVIVTADAAERIRAANRQGPFLWDWKVCILVDEGR